MLIIPLTLNGIAIDSQDHIVWLYPFLLREAIGVDSGNKDPFARAILHAYTQYAGLGYRRLRNGMFPQNNADAQ